jgi:hypothetical protein
LVTFTPASQDYTTLTKSVPLVVNKANPVTTWLQPNAITVGTALASAQLSASSQGAGTFAYEPGSGAMLPVGEHDLTAQFTPADTANYNTVSMAVTLRVTDFALAVQSTADSLTVPFGSGQSANGTVAISSLAQFNGNVGLTCLNLPATMGCKFEQQTVVIGGNDSATTLEVTTTGRSVTYTGWFVFFGGISTLWATRRRTRAYGSVLLVVLGLAGLGLSGCAGGSVYTQTDGTPQGTYTFTVSGTSGNLVHSVPVTVVVK